MDNTNGLFKKYLGEDGIYLAMAKIMSDCSSAMIQIADEKRRGINPTEEEINYIKNQICRVCCYAMDESLFVHDNDTIINTMIDEIFDLAVNRDSDISESLKSIPSFLKDIMLQSTKGYLRKQIMDSFKRNNGIEDLDIDSLFFNIIKSRQNYTKEPVDKGYLFVDDLDPKLRVWLDEQTKHCKSIDEQIDDYLKAKKKKDQNKNDTGNSDAENS